MKKVLFSATLFLFSGLLVYGQECGLRITGHVHSTTTHENLPYASVTLQEKNITIITDVKGDFRFDSLCAGSYSILITHGSYDTVMRTVLVSKNLHLDFDLVPAQHVLHNVTVTGVRSNPVAGIKTELSGRELEEARGRTLAEALSRMSGVTLLQTGTNISKPVVHGLHGNRLLTINNGIRQEGQQWGNEHVPEIDLFIANRLTIVKGADELRYGSDAIGGVILVEPRSLRSTPGYNAEFNTMYFTNNRQYVASAIYEQQLKKFTPFTYRLQATYKKGANVSTPNYRLNNTAMEEKNFSLTAGYRKEHFNSELYYSYFNTTIGIFSGAHIGNLNDLLNAISAERPDPTFTGEKSYRIERPNQQVQHHLLKSRSSFDVGNSKFTVLLAGQFNNRKEYDVLRSSASRGPQINLSVVTLTEEINWEHPRKNNFSGTVGLVAMQQDNSYSGRYLIPNYRSYTYGGYAIERWSRNKLDLQAGLRYDRKDLSTSRLQSASQNFTSYDFNFSTLASSFYAAYRLVPELKSSASVSLSTRAPHVNELLTNGIHHGTGTYELGDIQLRPERSLNTAISNTYTSKNNFVSAEVTLYRNSIDDFIYQQPKPDEPVLTIRGAFPKLVYQATDAVLSGMDASLTLAPLKNISIVSRYSLLRARNRSTDDWLIGMPADRFSNEISYTLPSGKRFKDTYVSAELQNVLRQKRVPDEKNGRQDYKAPPAAYSLLHADFHTSFTLGKLPLGLHIGARNLLNKAYRDYLNLFRYFTDEMGRNISLRLKLNLQHFY